MLNGGGRRLSLTIKRSLSRSDLPKSFDLDLVTANYEEQTRRATIAPRSGDRAALSSLPPIRLVLPPPNATGQLHIGHALTVTIEDAIVRHHRVKGGEATWLPGMDHAGIATQSVVEREMWMREKKTRREMGREEFVRRCGEFGSQNATVIRDQIARMGATLQWDSEYSLDERFSSAVTRAFVTLHRQGLISRDKRFVHWSPALRRSLSDQEVDKVELPPGGVLSLPSPDGKGRREVKLGVMHTVKYELIGGRKREFLCVATTRPETIYADIALAVHPSHPRVEELRGRRARNPLDGRELPIVVDEAVLADKGTGILKITPSHYGLDAEIASIHWEEIEEVVEGARTRSCLDEYGRMHGGTPLDGIDRFDARATVLHQLQSIGHLVESKDGATTTVSLCSRTGDIIEPRQTHQWFLDCKEMHAEAAAAMRDGRLSIFPRAQFDRLLEWFSHAEPWCLSRQHVWGHRIPAWNLEGTSEWIVENSEEDARNGREEGMRLRQDEDVLDTWFSSGLVPLVCSGWMDMAQPHYPYPPLSILETDTDILELWVARMVILTMRLSGGQVPSSRVFIHGMVRDAEGRKMSKSIGNVVDPLDVIDGISLQKMEERLGESALSEKEKATALSSLRSRFPSGIPRCGADSLRFALLRHDILASDVSIDIGSLAVEGLRFCDKLWNLTAYASEVRGKVEKELAEGDEGEKHVMDAWLRSRLASSLSAANYHMKRTATNLALTDIHYFMMRSLSVVYVESTKSALRNEDKRRLVGISRTLDDVLAESLRQLSVFMPFVSHFLFDQIKNESIYDSPLNYSRTWVDKRLEYTVSEVLAVAAAARSLKQRLGVSRHSHFEGVLYTTRPRSALQPLLPFLSRLCNVSIDTVLPLTDESPEGYEHIPVLGQQARLALKVEKRRHKVMRNGMEWNLNSAVGKKEYFLQNAARYEEIAKEERTRGKNREKSAERSEKRREYARDAALSAQEDEERIRLNIYRTPKP